MRVLVAFDKFKEAISAPAACATVINALRAAHPNWTFDSCPLTDGGDGFVDALAAGQPASMRVSAVAGPLGYRVEARWALVSSDQIPTAAARALQLSAPPLSGPLAVIEMAASSGLALVPRTHRDPLRLSTLGTGELIARAIEAGAAAVLLGVGGSATNDLGVGALAALGFRFVTSTGETIESPAPIEWSRIAKIVAPARRHLTTIFIACDVTNPAFGPNGATFTYGPQKGLPSEQLATTDAAMRRIGGLLAESTGATPSLYETPGAGAAGGIAGGFMAGLGARLVPGFDLVSSWLDLERRIAAADLIITGEGSFDATSLQGKGPGTLVRQSLAAGKRTIVLAGRVDLPSPPPGLEARPITPAGMPLSEALPATHRLLAAAAAAISESSGPPSDK